MKGYGVILITLVLIGLTAGCLGGNGGETTLNSTTSGGLVLNTSSTSGVTTTTTAGESTTATQTPKEPDTTELLKSVSAIRQFTYTSNTTIRMLVSTEQNGTSQADNVTLTVIETGYMDYESWSAWINSTTVSLPDNVRTNTSRVIVDNVTYLQTLAGWVKTEDPTASGILWDYSIVSLAREHLREKPDSIESGDVVKLVYSIPDYEIEPLAKVYFAASPDTTVDVSDGVLELYFRGKNLTGGRLSFSVRAESRVEDPLIGNMTITLDGSWTELTNITSINEKKGVKAPST